MKKAVLTFFFFLLLFGVRSQVLFGVTSQGGAQNAGVIFSFNTATNTFLKLKDFNGGDGAFPYAKLFLAKDGKFYGTTLQGGSNGYGVMYSFDPRTNDYVVLKDFSQEDGGYPYGGVVQAGNGKLYGMTPVGGKNYYGTVYSIDPVTKTFAKLRDLGPEEGIYPYGDFVEAPNGKLYAMPQQGGKYGLGLIFSLDPTTNVFVGVKDFNVPEGVLPTGTLTIGKDGKLYGTTNNGGENSKGTLFSFNPSANTYEQLFDFVKTNTAYPRGTLLQAKDGKFYGITSGGGKEGAGVMYSFDPVTKAFATLKDFSYSEFTLAAGSLIQASDGKLYGEATYYYFDRTHGGVLFSYDLSTSTYKQLKEFSGPDGKSPEFSAVTEYTCTQTTYYEDADKDGYGNRAVSLTICSSNPPAGYTTDSTDCDDTNRLVNPKTAWYLDSDGDGYYTGAAVMQCTSPGEGYKYERLKGGGDCNDTNAAAYPGATEVCDGVDNDCNGQIDETCNTKVVSFTLVNTSKDKDMQSLNDGEVIDLSLLPRVRTNIRANTSPYKVGSVVFSLSVGGHEIRKHVENGTPYALFRNIKGDYFGGSLQQGEYTLTATPYSKEGGKGVKGSPLTIHFKIVYPADITRFVIVNAETGKDITDLKEGDAVNLSVLPSHKISIRVSTNPDRVGSVVFNLFGQERKTQTENYIPYALFGGSTKQYTPWTPTSGAYKLTATPFSAYNANGAAGDERTIHFTVVDIPTNACTEPRFSPAVRVSDEGALAGTTGDFNRDGKLDLAIVRGFSNYIGILLGNGDGTFKGAIDYLSGGSNPRLITTGDFNGDGKLDIATGNLNDYPTYSDHSTIGILLGKGDGYFEEVVPYSTGGGTPSSLTVGDFNGDGKSDLAVSNYQTQNVAVLIGKGDGSFKEAKLFAGTGFVRSVKAADVNHDGKEDVVVLSTDYTGFHGNVGLLTGKGDGSFNTVINLVNFDSGPISLLVNDFNADGNPDVVVANLIGTDVNVLLGKGDGSFSKPISYSSGGDSPAFLVTGDFNVDGKPDLAVGKIGVDFGTSVLLGNGDGTFRTAKSYPNGSLLGEGDVNGDGKPDLLVYYDGIHVRSNTCTATIPSFLTSTVGKQSNEAETKQATLKIDALPNPFSEGLTVHFSIPVNGHARLSLYNSSGAEVKNLFQGNAEAEKEYQLHVDGKRLPAGVYMLRLMSEKQAGALKIIRN